MGPAASGVRDNGSWKPDLTDDERTLRDLAYPLIEPPYDRNRWYSVLNEYGILGPPRPDRNAYAERLFKTAYRSQTARYNRMIEDIRNDVVRLDPFFAVAQQVADMDHKRKLALERIGAPTPEARDRALKRIAQNGAIIQWVQDSLLERCLAYKIALDRLVIEAPSPIAVEVERSLTFLQQQASSYRGLNTAKVVRRATHPG